MALDLTSARAKLRRAEDHFKAVNDDVGGRLQPSDYKVAKHINADATEHSWVFHATKGMNFEDISLIAGDCIHNLRSALDHLVYAIAVHESSQDPPPDARRLAFPITCKPSEFADARRRIKSLSDSVRAAIEAVQPYNRPHPEFPPLLGLLGEFDDLDKHRLLQVTIGVFNKASFGYDNIPPGTKFQFGVNKRPLEDGAVIATMIFETPHPNMQGSFDGDLMLAIPHVPGPTGSRGTEVRSLLMLIKDEVRAVIDIVAAAVQ